MATTEPMAPRPVELTDRIKSQLNSVSTATLAYQLQARGIRNFFFSGLKPTRPERRMIGHALTLRLVPMREDLKPQLADGFNAQRQAVEGIGPDEVLVVGARGRADSGTLGDIFATRALKRGAAGIVTDGSPPRSSKKSPKPPSNKSSAKNSSSNGWGRARARPASTRSPTNACRNTKSGAPSGL